MKPRTIKLGLCEGCGIDEYSCKWAKKFHNAIACCSDCSHKLVEVIPKEAITQMIEELKGQLKNYDFSKIDIERLERLINWTFKQLTEGK